MHAHAYLYIFKKNDVSVQTRIFVSLLSTVSRGAYHLKESFGNSGWKVKG